MPRLALVKIDIMPTPPRSADHGRRHPAVAVAPKKTTSLLPCIGMPDDRKPLREISAWELAGRTTNRRLGVQRTLRRPRTSDTTASTKDAFFKLTVDASASSLYHRPVQAGATTTALQRPVSSITRIEMRTHHQMPAPVTRIDVKSHASVDEEHDDATDAATVNAAIEDALCLSTRPRTADATVPETARPLAVAPVAPPAQQLAECHGDADAIEPRLRRAATSTPPPATDAPTVTMLYNPAAATITPAATAAITSVACEPTPEAAATITPARPQLTRPAPLAELQLASDAGSDSDKATAMADGLLVPGPSPVQAVVGRVLLSPLHLDLPSTPELKVLLARSNAVYERVRLTQKAKKMLAARRRERAGVDVPIAESPGSSRGSSLAASLKSVREELSATGDAW